MRKPDKEEIIHVVKDYAKITVGLIIYLFSYFCFIYSHKITSGGLAGISSVISWGFDVPFSLPYNVINIALLCISLKVIGWKFSLKTVYSVLFMGLGSTLVETVLLPRIGDSLPLSNQPAMAMVLGSILIGMSLGVVFSVDGSTGGTDIVATIINKYKQVSIGRALIYIDICTLTASWFIFKDSDKLVFSVVQMLVTNLSVDYYLNGVRQCMQFFIITRKPEEMAQQLMREVGHGVTYLDGAGAYSGAQMKVLMMITRKTESVAVFRTVKTVDPNAFISQALVKGVYGQGFDNIKHKAIKTPSEQQADKP